jgi:hypothetical protein
MPDRIVGESEKDWMGRCVPQAVQEGMEQAQAVAVCLAKFREPPEKALEFDMLMTKAEAMPDGRTRWQARGNTGEWDLERERFDVTFWDDVCYNFSRTQEAITRSETPPDGMPVPILDIAHYSFRLPPERRNMARAGYPIKAWKDGKAIMFQGYFDDTPLGRAAAKAARERPVSERRISVGVWPDWGRVELDAEGRRIYKGGRGRAYLDHLAMTAHPIDPGTVLEVKSMTQAQDGVDVLGEENRGLIDELEAAKTKAADPAAVIKAEPECACKCESEQKAAEPAPVVAAVATVKAEAKPAEPAAEDRPYTRGDMETFLKRFVKEFLSSFKSELDGRLEPVEAAIAEIAAVKARVDALSATETEKVQKAIDSVDGDWLGAMMKASVQRRQTPVESAGPKQTADTSDPFYQTFPGLKPK